MFKEWTGELPIRSRFQNITYRYKIIAQIIFLNDNGR